LCDLLPNLHYFNELLQALKAQEAAHEAMVCRTWRLEGFNDRGG